MRKLNKEQAEKIFYANAVAIEGRDVFPFDTAALLFGLDAVDYIFSKGFDPVIWNMYSIPGAEDFFYMTYKGYMHLVTYSNVCRKDWEVSREVHREGNLISIDSWRGRK